MPKYLFKASYTANGAQGVMAEGGSARVKQANAVIEGAGGTVESFHFAFGGADVYVIAEFPDNASVAAASLVVNATGAIAAETIVLLTAEELDAAAKQAGEVAKSFRPPGA